MMTTLEDEIRRIVEAAAATAGTIPVAAEAERLAAAYGDDKTRIAREIIRQGNVAGVSFEIEDLEELQRRDE
jgi:hypothetical protein